MQITFTFSSYVYYYAYVLRAIVDEKISAPRSHLLPYIILGKRTIEIFACKFVHVVVVYIITVVVRVIKKEKMKT